MAAPDVKLRRVLPSDFAILFAHHADPEAARMAAFGTRDADAAAFEARLRKYIDAGSVTQRTIVLGDAVVGSIATFVMEDKPQITYWIDRAFWGRGVATAALRQFLAIVTTRPVYASAAKDNVGSLRVLEKCGFVVVGSETAFASARGEDVEEVFLELR